ncbi:MAG TPA: serine/threonine-protein kinase [Verrucomicrobiae bacterium]|nr:serine/threonine-protein kinase [Verrucomicrobiae bacterium]
MNGTEAPMSSPHEREQALFILAAAKPVAERAAFLQRECGEDKVMRARVEALLAAQEGAETSIDAPSGQVNATTKLESCRNSPDEGVGRKIGRYKILEKLGEGGCGVVYIAEQTEPVRRRVALKVIKLGMDTKQVVARFEAERQALAMMDHPNIAKVLDAGATETGRPYFVMELVRGIRITEYCDQLQVTTHQRLELFINVCQAIQHAHQKGIIHRDIKPSNILVTIHDGVPVPKVIDFGIAKAIEGRLSDSTIYTQLNQFIGTPAYMSPEQAEMSGLDIDTRSDIYSLGVLLYELLVGTTPIDPQELLSQGIDAIRKTVREKEPATPSARLTNLPAAELTTTAKRRASEASKLIRQLTGDLDWIVMKCLEKDRTRRFETANGLAADIRRYLNNEPVVARPPSTAYRIQKAFRRNKIVFTAAALVATALVVGLVASALEAVRARRAEQLAEQRRLDSDKARAEAEAVSGFMTQVFQSPDPARDGRTVTVAETLNRATQKLESTLTNQPDRRARLEGTLGDTYRALGLFREAIPLEEKARDYYLATQGLEHPDTLKAMHNLARSYDDAGRRDEALKLDEQVLALRRKVLGPENLDTLATMNNLAIVYFESGRGEEALKLREQVLALYLKVNGPEDLGTLRAMLNLAVSQKAMGRFAEAGRLSEQALALCRKVFGSEHPSTLAAIANLGDCYENLGRRNDALKLREEVLALRRKVFGSDHPQTLSAMNNLAISYYQAGRGNDAVKLWEEVLQLRRNVLGPEHPDTLLAMNNLAYAYDALGRRDEAFKMNQEAMALCSRILGPEHPYTLNALNDLATSYDEVGRKDEALKLREQAVALRRKAIGPQDPDTLNAMVDLASSYQEAGRADEALKLQEEVLALRRKVLGLEHPDTVAAINALARSYLAAGQSDQALSLLTTAAGTSGHSLADLQLAACQAWFGKDADYTATCRRFLQWAKDSTKPNDAARASESASIFPQADPQMRDAALALAQRAVDLGARNNTPLLPQFQMTLGMAEYRAGHYPEADKALGAVAATASSRDKDTSARIEGVAGFYRAMSLFRQGREADAQALFAAAEATMKPLPADERKPTLSEADQDNFILWLAYKEARALRNPAKTQTP